MSESATPESDSQLAEFVALLAMLPDDERYAVGVELLDIAEQHSGEAE